MPLLGFIVPEDGKHNAWWRNKALGSKQRSYLFRTNLELRPKWSEGQISGKFGTGSVPMMRMCCGCHWLPGERSKVLSNLTCLCLCFWLYLMILIWVSSVHPASCPRKEAHTSTKSAGIFSFSVFHVLQKLKSPTRIDVWSKDCSRVEICLHSC